MRVFFVPVADRPECVTALKATFKLGHAMGASVIGCHIRPHLHSPITLPSAESQGVESAGAAAKVLFTHLAREHGYDLIRRPRAKPGAVWMEKTGSPGKVIGTMGPVVDLLVLSRPANKGSALARQFLLAALLRSGRPVLILPQTKKRSVGKRICIAWNQSVEAARAVAATLPLLAGAEHVSIVSSGPETRVGPKSIQLATYLKYWGIKTERFSTPGKDESKEILATYKSTNSDLLLMGAYTRNRMSNLIFGGVTRYMLERSSIPLVMLHS